jgi:hypothetical protein
MITNISSNQNNTKIFPEEYQIKDPERFRLLMQHLPQDVRRDLYSYHPKETTFAKHLASLEDGSIYGNKNIYKTSKIAILAYRIHKITFEELSTVFMHIGAIEELYLNPKMNCPIMTKDISYCFGSFLKTLNPDFSIPLTTSRGQVESTRRHSMGQLNEDYLNEISANGKLDRPYLKEFLALGEDEWEIFVTSINKAEKTEWWFSNLSPKGCWSPLYDQIQRIMHCFKTIEVYHKPSDYTRPPPTEDVLLLPSFSMMQTFIDVKAHTHGRKAVELAPVFGELSCEDVYQLKKEGKSPLGLYCPTPKGIDPTKTIKHMRYVDGWSLCGPLSFLLHDVAHVLRWQEMDENTCKAIFRILFLFDNIAEQYDKKSEKYEQISRLRNALIDGELLHSYPPKSSLYKTRPFKAQKFGMLFQNKKIWTDEFKEIVVFDMIKNRPLWQQTIQIGLNDLCDDTYIAHIALTYLFDGLDCNQRLGFIDVKAPDRNYTIKRSKIVNSNLKGIDCEIAWIIRSNIKSILASHRVVIEDCHELNSITLAAKHGCFFKDCTLNAISIQECIEKAQFVDCKIESMQSNCSAQFVQCEAKFIESKGTIWFASSDSEKYSHITAEEITWYVNEENMKFDTFHCKKLHIMAENYDKPIDIRFFNCTIDELYLYGKSEKCSDILKYIGNTSSQVKKAHYASKDPLTENFKAWDLNITWN